MGERPVATKRARKTAAESDGSVVRVEAAFKAAFQQRFAMEYKSLAVAKERRHLKDMIGAYTEDSIVTEMVPTFFTTSDWKVQRDDYSIAAFYRLAQHVRLLANGHEVGRDARTAQNVDAAGRAVRRRS